MGTFKDVAKGMNKGAALLRCALGYHSMRRNYKDPYTDGPCYICLGCKVRVANMVNSSGLMLEVGDSLRLNMLKDDPDYVETFTVVEDEQE